MNFIKKISLFFKNILKKESTIKAIEEPKEIQKSQNKKEFVASLKIEESKKRVETLKCIGDGLGIQPKITG